MKTFRPYGILLGVVLAGLGAITPASAQTNDEIFPNLQWNFATPGARANGMGRTFIGTADDATATVTNPAGLLNLTRPQVYFEFKNTHLEFERLSATNSLTTGIPTVTDRNISALSFASVSYPVASRLAVAFSIHRFLDYREDVSLADCDIPGTNQVFFPVNGDADFKGTAYGGSVAYMVTKGLRVGVTIAANQFDAESTATRTGVPRPNFTTPANVVVNQTTIDSSEMAVSTTIGFIYKIPSEKFSAGFNYARSPRFKMEENLQFNPSTTTNQPLQQGTGFPKPVEINVPDHFGFGVSVRPVPRLLVAMDVVRTQYSSLSENTTLIFNPTDLSSSDYDLPDITEVHVGAEYNVYTIKGNPLLVRAGVFTNPAHLVRYTGTANGNATVLATENAKYNILAAKDETRGTIGGGIVIGRRSQIDFAYVFGSDFVASAAVRF